MIDGFEQLFSATRPDFRPYYTSLHGVPDLGAGDLDAGDTVITKGDRQGWGDTADF